MPTNAHKQSNVQIWVVYNIVLCVIINKLNNPYMHINIPYNKTKKRQPKRAAFKLSILRTYD